MSNRSDSMTQWRPILVQVECLIDNKLSDKWLGKCDSSTQVGQVWMVIFYVRQGFRLPVADSTSL